MEFLINSSHHSKVATGDLDIPAIPEGKATSLSSGAIHLLGTTVTGSA